jgi:cytochrome c2
MKSLCPRASFLLGAVLCGAVFVPGAIAQSPADAERGRAVFTAKHCARCHVPSGQQGVGPALEKLRRPQGAYELSGRLWNHAPAMFTVLKQEGIGWPAISAVEMADLMAYLQADPKADAAPDLAKGRMTLISKGCLKCHSFRREGGHLGPDLAERRADYAPASTWAATMWSHTPRMAAAAIQQGVLYPRFTGDEMVNLLGFLRTGAGAP